MVRLEGGGEFVVAAGDVVLQRTLRGGHRRSLGPLVDVKDVGEESLAIIIPTHGGEMYAMRF